MFRRRRQEESDDDTVSAEVDQDEPGFGTDDAGDTDAFTSSADGSPTRPEGPGDEAPRILKAVRESGGEANDDSGPFGTELKARIPVEAPGAGPSLQPARFIGVDGPRWFLRGMLTGPAATDPVQAKRLEEIFRGTVVVRGGEAMAPRELLPLRLPREAVEHPPAEAASPELEIFQRGPEITEIQ